MVHKIHNGQHLPSVLGVATKPDGSRDYGATPTPYVHNGKKQLLIAGGDCLTSHDPETLEPRPGVATS